MDETTIDIDGMAADAIAGNILSAIDVSPDRIESFTVESTVANDDGIGTVFELSASGQDAGNISQRLLSSFDWSSFTASAITVRAEIADGTDDPPETPGADGSSGGENEGPITRDRDGGYTWSPHDQPKVDEPVGVAVDTRSYRVLYYLVEDYDDEPLTAKELAAKLQARGESFKAPQVTALLSRLFVEKALVDREKSSDGNGTSFAYWPIGAAEDLVEENGEPE